MKHAIHWKTFFVLLVMSLVSVACIFPYILTIQADLIESVGMPIALIFVIQLTQSAFLFSILIFFGLLLTQKIGFNLPLIEACLKGKEWRPVLKSIAAPALAWGVVVAFSIYVVDILFTFLGATLTTHQNYAPLWQTLLASFYGGITEEVIMRLFFMSLIIWIGMKMLRQSVPKGYGIWVAIVLVAIVFGLGHLPITASLTSLSPIIVTRAIILNGIGGVVFGWLFWKKGLESAMIAHFATDIVLLSILPMVLQ